MPVLRRAKIREAGALAALARRTWREMSLDDFAIPYPPEDVAAFEAMKSIPSVVEARLADPQQATWVVEEAGELIGFADAGPCGLPHPEADVSQLELNRLYVLRSRQGRGHGRLLMNAALEWMSSRSSGPQWVGVWSGNLPAQRFYASYGFEKVGEYDFPVGRWQDRDFILRRSRPPSPLPVPVDKG